MSDIDFSGIILLTGLPGAGKTLRMVELMHEAVALGRPCYASNVNGLNVPGVTPFENPHEWETLEAGSVLFVDEAQRYFRQRAGFKEVPPYILAMETIRHTGVTLVLTTQQPTYLDKHLRGLVGRHEHRIEIIAGTVSNQYAFRRCEDDISDSNMAASTFTVWNHPKQYHGCYKSAEVHTKKARIPKRFVILGVGAIACLAALVYAFGGDGPVSKNAAGGAAPAAPLRQAATVSDPGRPMTAAEYAMQQKPRISTAPWSAPLYDDRAAVAQPALLCMSSQPGNQGDGTWTDEYRCSCLTEQGTVYEVPDVECRRIARFGPVYNPFKESPELRAEGMPGQGWRAGQPALGVIPMASGPAQSVGIGQPGRIQRYGAFRGEATGPDGPYPMQGW